MFIFLSLIIINPFINCQGLTKETPSEYGKKPKRATKETGMNHLDTDSLNKWARETGDKMDKNFGKTLFVSVINPNSVKNEWAKETGKKLDQEAFHWLMQKENTDPIKDSLKKGAKDAKNQMKDSWNKQKKQIKDNWQESDMRKKTETVKTSLPVRATISVIDGSKRLAGKLNDKFHFL
jgi:hypothetical protein